MTLVINGKEIGTIEREYETKVDGRAYDLFDLKEGFTVSIRRMRRKLCDLITYDKIFIELLEEYEE